MRCVRAQSRRVAKERTCALCGVLMRRPHDRMHHNWRRWSGLQLLGLCLCLRIFVVFGKRGSAKEARTRCRHGPVTVVFLSEGSPVSVFFVWVKAKHVENLQRTAHAVEPTRHHPLGALALEIFVLQCTAGSHAPKACQDRKDWITTDRLAQTRMCK